MKNYPTPTAETYTPSINFTSNKVPAYTMRALGTPHGLVHVQRAGLQRGTKHGVFHFPGRAAREGHRPPRVSGRGVREGGSLPTASLPPKPPSASR